MNMLVQHLPQNKWLYTREHCGISFASFYLMQTNMRTQLICSFLVVVAGLLLSSCAVDYSGTYPVNNPAVAVSSIITPSFGDCGSNYGFTGYNDGSPTFGYFPQI
jgi:hypothetical protein